MEKIREQIEEKGETINHRLRVGCDSYYFFRKGIRINIKDSISATHRASICENCREYCQEGIYSLKHSASGWISVCPSNNPDYGTLLSESVTEKSAHEQIDKYVKLLNETQRFDQTGEEFYKRRELL